MIPDPDALALFVVAAIALLVVPGPAVLYIVARSIHQGRRAGLASVLGIHVGTGSPISQRQPPGSQALVVSAVAFTAVKIAGAVYLSGSVCGRSSRGAPSRRSRSAASGTSAGPSRRGSSSTS